MASEPILESTPLLASPLTPVSSVFDRVRRAVSDNYVINLIYLIVFCVMCGYYLQPAPRTEIYESIICQDYYASTEGHEYNELLRDCKVKPVQEALALIKGVERLMELAPTLFVIPYGLLADKWGRRNVLSLGVFGTALGETWGLVICLCSLPIRLLWTQWVWQIIGGGATVTTTMLYLILCDITPEESRIIVFFRLHAATTLAAIVGPTLSSFLMPYSLWLPWILGESLYYGSIGLTFLLPNTTAQTSSGAEPQESYDEGDDNTVRGKKLTVKERLTTTLHMARSSAAIVFTNGQVLLLLGMTLLGILGQESLFLMLLQYITKRYQWDYAEAGFLFSLTSSIQFIFLLFLLPLASHILLNSLHLSSQAKDRFLAILSSAALAIGAFCLGIAPHIGLAIAGIILMSTGAGLFSILRSTITSHVAPEDVSVVYSVMSLLMVAGAALAGPLYNVTFVAGLRLGPAWLGMPYLVAGGMLALAFVMALFVRAEREGDLGEQVAEDSALLRA